jgi:hypothetical protein
MHLDLYIPNANATFQTTDVNCQACNNYLDAVEQLLRNLKNN